MRCPTSCRLQRTGTWHDQEISQVAIPSHTTHLCKGKTFYAGVFIAVTGTIVATGDRIRTELYHTERRSSSRKGFAQAMINTGCTHTGARADERIHIISRFLCNANDRNTQNDEQE